MLRCQLYFYELSESGTRIVFTRTALFRPGVLTLFQHVSYLQTGQAKMMYLLQ